MGLRFFALLAALAPVGLAAVAQSTAEIRFCPAAVARPYPLDSLRGVQGLNLQNLAVLNTGQAPFEIEAVDIDLLRAGQVIDRRTLSGSLIESEVMGGQSAKAQGLLDAMAFQTCDGRLLGDSALAESPTLAPGQALLVMQQVFAWKGARDELRATARAKGGQPLASGSIRIDGSASKTVFRFPLKSGTWLIGAASSFHTTHRWAIPEEFALDVVKIGEDGRSHRGEGTRHSNFYAYDADVVAAPMVWSPLWSPAPSRTRPCCRSPASR